MPKLFLPYLGYHFLCPQIVYFNTTDFIIVPVSPGTQLHCQNRPSHLFFWLTFLLFYFNIRRLATTKEEISFYRRLLQKKKLASYYCIYLLLVYLLIIFFIIFVVLCFFVGCLIARPVSLVCSTSKFSVHRKQLSSKRRNRSVKNGITPGD